MDIEWAIHDDTLYLLQETEDGHSFAASTLARTASTG